MSYQAPLRSLLRAEWADRLQSSLSLLDGIDVSLGNDPCNPKREDIFRALDMKIEEIKVIVIGQDPYPNPEDADGLAFSIPATQRKFPPSLRNIFLEYRDDLQLPIPVTGDLTPWRDRGVMLLNTILSCQPHKSLSHADLGWQQFTHEVLRAVITEQTIGILWGERAKNHSTLFNPAFTISSPHPSPLSSYRGFFGSRPFSRTNEILLKQGRSPIDWSLRSA